MSEQRSALDRFLAAIAYAVASLALLSLLFWQASIRRTPTIFSDELEWSQLSRAIAATGHAARRGEPIGMKSLYAVVLAPFWWIHSTGSAYAAIKYVNTAIMALAAIPTYLLARMFVPRAAAFATALAALCTTALYYAPFVIPEVLAYPTFAFGAWLSVRALAGGGRRWTIAAIVVDLAATQVRGELMTLPAAFALAAIVLWLCGPRAARLRSGWGVADHLGAALLTLGVLIVLNRLLGDHSHQWKTVTESWKGRFWSLGMESASAFAIGLGLLPLLGGLASLWLPARRADPVWRAFAAFTGAALVSVWTYTAVKTAYNSTIFATRVEERNLIYLGPLVLVGTAVWLSSRRFWPGTLAAWAFTTWLVVYYGYQLDFPYFEAPGYGIAAMANRAWHWDQPTIQIAIGIACLILLLAATLAPRPVLLLACACAIAWMLAGEVTSSRGSAIQSKGESANLAKPLDWVDRATSGRDTTFLGQNISSGQALGVNLLEFWNRNVHRVWSLDGSARGPGPTLSPDLVDRDGTLSHDPGAPYVVAANGVDLIGPVVARRPGLTVYRVGHPWRLHQASYGVSDDGWISGSTEVTSANGTYAYFGPQRTAGTLTVVTARKGFCSQAAPPAHVVVRVGPLALNEQRAPTVARATHVERYVLANCGTRTLTFTIAPPLAVQVTASPTVQPTQYGGSDNRELGAQVGFSFSAR